MLIKKITTDVLRRKFFCEEQIPFIEIKNEENNIINIHKDETYQKWMGLGGALTGSTIYNFNKLSLEKQDKLLDDYYKGLNYNYLRLPIGSTDFSPKPVDDYTVDFDDNIRIINRIKEKKDIKILATPWSPPKKYKDNSSLYGGKLLKQFYGEYANYLVNFIKDYEFANIKIDYLSIQNEPFVNQRWESCTFSINEMKDFIYNYLIPKLKNTKIVLWDHNKDNLYNIFKRLYEKNSKIIGVGFHWYTGGFYEELDLIRKNYPKIILFETEMCCGFSRYKPRKWIKDSEYYINEIINGINNGLNVFIDWNILLNYHGGPNHKFNNCKSPIILNKWGNDYIKTPIYYYLKHIGIANKGTVLKTSSYSRNEELEVVAIQNEKTYITVLNQSKDKKRINIRIGDNMIKDNIEKHSIVTYICN
ncbi:MAG: hypothetical protein IKG56_02765 [Clostridia bacterium]|nr:hypothetical protein [Clostridia bacterium]